MRLLIQRVSYANILIDKIDEKNMQEGVLVYIGLSREDINIEDKTIIKAVNKLLNLRFFEDENGKLKKSTLDISSNIMIVPSFTLYAEARTGNSLSFDKSAEYKKAQIIYDKFVLELKNRYDKIFTGKFRSDMDITYKAIGPVNVILDF